MSYDYDYEGFGFARGGGAAAAPAAPARAAPSAPASAPAAVGRADKTQVMNHAQQSAIGGPGASPMPGPGSRIGGPGGTPQAPGGINHIPPGGMAPGRDSRGGVDHGPIGERRGDPGGFPHDGAREHQTHPDQFRDFDPRFNRDRGDARYWRHALSDYERTRFLPYIGGDPYVEYILGLNYYPEYAVLGVPYYPVDPGEWVIGVDGRWHRVRRHQRRIIEYIDSLRYPGRNLYQPVIIPGVGYPYPTQPVATPYYPPPPGYPPYVGASYPLY